MSLHLRSRDVDLGGGLIVRRVLPQRALRKVGPWVFVDHFGPAEGVVDPERDVRPHPHCGLSTVSSLFEGATEHRDSTGGEGTIRAGEVQRMSAGTGVMHSEYNASQNDEVHFLQIWILPDKENHKPGYEQKHYTETERRGKLRLVASGDSRNGSVHINRDADMFAGLFQRGEEAKHKLASGRLGWLHVAKGAVHINGSLLHAGDGVAFETSEEVHIHDGENAEVLLFDMAY